MNTTTNPPVTRRVAYPGELGIPPTGIAFHIPEGWESTPVRGALAVLRAPHAGAGDFHPNLVVSVDRMTPDVTLAGAAQDVLDDARESADRLHLADERVIELIGVPAIVREQILHIDAIAVPLVQFVVLTVIEVGGGLMRDVVQLTLTAPDGARDELVALLDVLTQTLEIDA